MRRKVSKDPLFKFEVEEIRDLIAQGKKVMAVRRVRELTGWGLKQAKDYVDALEEEQ